MAKVKNDEPKQKEQEVLEKELTDDELNEIAGGVISDITWYDEESVKRGYNLRYKKIMAYYKINSIAVAVSEYMEMCSIYKKVGVKYGLTNPDELLPDEVLSALRPGLPAFWSKFWR